LKIFRKFWSKSSESPFLFFLAFLKIRNKPQNTNFLPFFFLVSFFSKMCQKKYDDLVNTGTILMNALYCGLYCATEPVIYSSRRLTDQQRLRLASPTSVNLTIINEDEDPKKGPHSIQFDGFGVIGFHPCFRLRRV
jgi:hypothetical protein